MKTYTIYKHTNKINGKSYIGITSRALNKRWCSGKGYTKAHQPAFFNAINKYGWDNFDHQILETGLTFNDANSREKYWIAYYHTWIYDPQCNGYNITQGGDGTPGHKWSDEFRAKKNMKVYCKELDKIFNSLTEAAAETGATISKISECCRGRRDTAGSYHWSYLDEKLRETGEATKQHRISSRYSGNYKKVFCIKNGQKYIFKNMKEASFWWFETEHPCGDTYDKAVLYSKIRDSIKGISIYTGKNQYVMQEITNIKWYKED